MSSETNNTSMSTANSTSSASPIVIDLGKKSRKRVKDLRKGKPGKLINQIHETIDTLKAEGSISANAQPIIVVVRERARRGAWPGM